MSDIITDEYMRDMMGRTQPYTVVLLRPTEKRHSPDADAIVWEHGRRNFALRASGKLPIVCPIRDGSDLSGVGIFNADVDETRRIMDEDPGVQAGIFTYELHPTRTFPGDSLPSLPAASEETGGDL